MTVVTVSLPDEVHNQFLRLADIQEPVEKKNDGIMLYNHWLIYELFGYQLTTNIQSYFILRT